MLYMALGHSGDWFCWRGAAGATLATKCSVYIRLLLPLHTPSKVVANLNSSEMFIRETCISHGQFLEKFFFSPETWESQDPFKVTKCAFGKGVPDKAFLVEAPGSIVFEFCKSKGRYLGT